MKYHYTPLKGVYSSYLQFIAKFKNMLHIDLQIYKGMNSGFCIHPVVVSIFHRVIGIF